MHAWALCVYLGAKRRYINTLPFLSRQTVLGLCCVCGGVLCTGYKMKLRLTGGGGGSRIDSLDQVPSPSYMQKFQKWTSSCTTWFMARGCNPHRSLWRHWWRHNSETIRDREKRRPTWPHEILWVIQWWKPHRSTTTFAKPEITSFMTS